MALLPKVKFKALPTFPSTINGGAGIEVTKQNGAVTIDLDYNDFGLISVIPTSPTNNILTFDSATNSYVMIPSHLLGGAVAGISDAPNNGNLYGRQSAQWVQIPPDITNPVYYGADPTGVADSTSAIQQALTASNIVRFPAGTFKINSAIAYTFTADHGLKISGAGREATILLFPNNSGLGFIYNYPTNALTISDLSIVAAIPGIGGTNAAVTVFQNGVNNPHLASLTDFIRVACRGSDFSIADNAHVNYWRIAFDVNTLSNINWSSVEIYGSHLWEGIGIKLLGQSTNYAVIYNLNQCIFSKNNISVEIGSYIQGISITATNMTECHTCITLDSGSLGVAELAIVNSQFGFFTNGISIQADLLGLMISNNFFYLTPNSIGITVNGTTSNDSLFSITANHFEGADTTTTNGIYIASTTGPGHGIISNNSIWNLYRGIVLGTGAANVAIMGNTFGNASQPIFNQGTNVVIVNNPGYNPVGVAGITYPAASNATYTAGASPESHYLTGGTVTAVKVSGATIATSTPCQVHLGPYETYSVTYTVAPSLLYSVH